MSRADEESNNIVYRTSARFNAIYVLESLNSGLKTGEDLFDAVIYPAKAQLDGMHAQYMRVQTKEDFLRQLAVIAHATQFETRRPIVHIEAHGSHDGIELADETFITWQELIPVFTKINIACKNSLVVVATSCYGWNLTASLMPSDRAPVFMLVGPPDKMKAGDLSIANRRFYETLMSQFDLNRALEAMNDHLPFAEWLIRPATVEILYCRVFRQYIGEFGTPTALQNRENDLVARIAKARTLSLLESAALRLEVRQDLADHRAAYDRHREKFLMLDLFPADRERFGLTYDLCMPT